MRRDDKQLNKNTPIWIRSWSIKCLYATMFTKHVLRCVRIKSIFFQVMFSRREGETLFWDNKMPIFLHVTN